jgi:peptidyl-dipeptidase A
MSEAPVAIGRRRCFRTVHSTAEGMAVPHARLALVAVALVLLASCTKAPDTGSATAGSPDEFVARINEEMAELADEANAAGWVQSTYINVDTQLLNAKAGERYLAYFNKAVEESKAFNVESASPDSARALHLLKLGVSAPAPNDAEKRRELTQITTRMEAMYGEGKYCPEGAGKGSDACRNLDQLSETLAKSRNYDELTEAWTGWHTISRPMRKDYERFVTLANEGARELGFADLGAMWRSNYDMAPEAFEKEAARLYSQVKPLYDNLHCYARARLSKKYGEDKVPAGRPIPAHLFGNMWAQQWNKIYRDILEPYAGVANLNVDRALEQQKYDPKRMTQSAEQFYTSLGFPKLPETFWERSMLTRPRDREVVCHASAWHMDGDEDVRIKQCIVPAEEDLGVIYHEMGHVYYFLAYKDLPYLFQSSAHDGFHEAIGDTVVLSMTPGYLHTIGLVGNVQPSKEAVINQQMKMAADKIAFLPFGKLIDEWRWKVFDGTIKPADYNKTWWELREKYQGVAPPVQRTEEDFDPGAKYHIPGNTPYTRYFLAYILQFQFHRALCEAAGHTGPLHECSIYGNREAGRRFWEMLQAGQSRPWPETLEKLTGKREMDASAIIDYFAPLMSWLEEQNKGQTCGWDAGASQETAPAAPEAT